METLKSGLKFIGWDDGSFDFEQEKAVPLVGVIMRGGDFVEGIIKTEVTVDGLDGTRKMTDALAKSKHGDDIGLILLDGITVGGFNVIDIEKLSDKTGVPVLALMRKKPNLEDFRRALKKTPHAEQRLRSVRKAGEIRAMRLQANEIYYQKSGLSEAEAEQAVSITSTHSLLPEPVRLADMIAKSFVNGEY
jgi:endonuclease V-like protein UPF0215 family